MPVKSEKCDTCGDPVSLLASFVKLGKAYRHVPCHDERVGRVAIQNHEIAESNKRLLEMSESKERETATLRGKFDALPRCPKCGVRIADTLELEAAAAVNGWGETRTRQSGQDRCVVCVREEAQARATARRSPVATTPAQAIQSAPTAPVQAPDTKAPAADAKDRFNLIEME